MQSPLTGASPKAGFCSRVDAWLRPQKPQHTWWQEAPMSHVVVPWLGNRTETHCYHQQPPQEVAPHPSCFQRGPQVLELVGGTDKAGQATATLPGTGPPCLSPTWTGSTTCNCRVTAPPRQLHVGLASSPPKVEHSVLPGFPQQPKAGSKPLITKTRGSRWDSGRDTPPQALTRALALLDL